MGKEDKIHEILFSQKKNEHCHLQNMDGVLSETRERQRVYDLTYMWNLKNFNSQKQRVE